MPDTQEILTSILEKYQTEYIDKSEEDDFCTLHLFGYYPLADFYYNLLSNTLEEFLEFLGTSISDQFASDFISLSGYSESDLSNVTVLQAIHSKILNSSTLLEENTIEESTNVVLLNKRDIKTKIHVFNPIQYLIESPDVLIAATPLFANSGNTDENFEIYIFFAIFHLICSPSGEHRPYIPKSINSPTAVLFPSKGSDCDNFHFTSIMLLPISDIICKLDSTEFDICTAEEKSKTINLEHVDESTTGSSLFFKINIKVFTLKNGDSNYNLTIFSTTPGSNESFIEMYTTFTAPNSNFIEALNCNQNDILFHVTRATGHNVVLIGGYGRLEIYSSEGKDETLTDFCDGVIEIKMFQRIKREVEVNSFITKFLASEHISYLGDIDRESKPSDCSLTFNFNSNSCLCIQPVSEVEVVCDSLLSSSKNENVTENLEEVAEGLNEELSSDFFEII